VTTLLITGASRGIGLEMVRQANARGWRVYACCRSPQKAEKLQSIAQSSKGQVSVHPLDVSDLGQIQALSFALGNTPIDILINNAGRYGSMKHQFGNVDATDWLETFKVNTIAPYKMAEAFIHNIERGNKKIIANLSSKMGSMSDNSSGGSYIYRSTKTALNAVLKSMAIDLKERGICCINFHPGWVKTEMGGPNAEISAAISVENIFNKLDRLTIDDSGSFFDIDGSIIPW